MCKLEDIVRSRNNKKSEGLGIIVNRGYSSPGGWIYGVYWFNEKKIIDTRTVNLLKVENDE